MDLQEIVDHRLTILEVLCLNVDGCTTNEELAKRILEWLKEKEERMEILKDRAAYDQASCWSEAYRFKDFYWDAREGVKGINTWTDEDIIHHLECQFDIWGNHEDLITYLTKRE